MSSNTKISIVIPTRDRPKELARCLRAIQQQTLLPYEVIVVNDGKKKINREAFRSCKFSELASGRQKGQSWAKNLGVFKACGEILVFIDDDCLPERDWLWRLTRAFKHTEIAVVVGRIIEKRRQGKKDSFSDIILNLPFYPLYFLIRKSAGGTIYPNGRVDQNLETTKRGFCHWGGAGNMAIRKTCFMKAGGFDRRLLPGSAMEEPDLCWRILQAGSRIFYNGRASVSHYPPSCRRLSPDKEIYNLRANEVYFSLKNLVPQGFFYFLLFLIYQAWQVLIYSLLSLGRRKCWLRVMGKQAGIKYWRGVFLKKANENSH